MEAVFPYMITPTGDQTDRSADIEAALSAFGTAVLAPGKFYVSGIQMPAGTALFGFGAASEVILIDEIASGNMRVYKGNEIVDPIQLTKYILNR